MLEKIGNYQAAVALIAGLSSSAICRLKKTVDMVDRKYRKVFLSSKGEMIRIIIIIMIGMGSI